MIKYSGITLTLIRFDFIEIYCWMASNYMQQGNRAGNRGLLKTTQPFICLKLFIRAEAANANKWKLHGGTITCCNSRDDTWLENVTALSTEIERAMSERKREMSG